MPYNKALLAKYKRQSAEAAADAHYTAASHSHLHAGKKYWMLNAAGRRSDRPYTIAELAAYLGPHASPGVWKQYTLIPVS